MNTSSPPPYGTKPENLALRSPSAPSEANLQTSNYYHGIPIGQVSANQMHENNYQGQPNVVASSANQMHEKNYQGQLHVNQMHENYQRQPNVVAAPPMHHPMQQPLNNNARMSNNNPSIIDIPNVQDQANTNTDVARLQQIQSQIMNQVQIKMASLCCNMIILVLAVFTLGIALVCAIGTFAATIQANKEIEQLADEATTIAVSNQDQRVQMLNNNIQRKRPMCFMI